MVRIEMPQLFRADLAHVLEQTRPLWEEARDQRIFITGGTGFFGSWLVESFAWANQNLDLNASATVLTRNPVAFARKAPHVAADTSIKVLQGDVRDFTFPDEEYAYVIHAATEASLHQAENAPLEMMTTVVDGTRHVLEFALARGTRKFLLTSSGAVYGKQPSDLTHIPESYMGAPDPLDPSSVYGEGKRMAEQMCVLYSAGAQLECKIARCFAFVGAHLPLDTHFAIGNFIRDAIEGNPIRIQGDGTPMRSYLYAADLAIWLWTILFKGTPLIAWNVGSENDLSIAELAREVSAAIHPGLEISIAREPVVGASRMRYVPSVRSAREHLNLRESTNLHEGIRRTARWYKRLT